MLINTILSFPFFFNNFIYTGKIYSTENTSFNRPPDKKTAVTGSIDTHGKVIVSVFRLTFSKNVVELDE